MPIFKSSVIYSYYFTLILLQKCPYKAFHLQENPWKLLWQIQVFNNFKIITLDWVRIFKILIKNRLIHKGANPRWNKIEVSYREQNKQVKKTVIFMTIYNIAGSLMFDFSIFKENFFSFLWSYLWLRTRENNYFSLCLIPPEFRSSYFYFFMTKYVFT